MPHRIRRSSIFLTLVAVWAICSGKGVRADLPTPAPVAEAPSSPDAQIARLVTELGNEKWALREKAAKELERFGPGAYDILQAAYARSDRYEVRDRIKRVAYEIHMTEQFGPVRAFLGVSHDPFDASTLNEPRMPLSWSGLKFKNVIPESPAAKAGIATEDVLLGLNGVRASEAQPAIDFIKWIGQQSPGTVCHLTVYHGGQGRILNDSTMANGFDPRGFRRAKTRVVTWTEDTRLPESAVGLELTDVSRTDKRLDLKEGDLIIALDGFLLSGESAEVRFRDWIKNEPKPEDEQDDARRRAAAGGGGNQGIIILGGRIANPQESQVTPSIQIVRGGEVKEIELTLAARPPNLNGGRAFQRSMLIQNQSRPRAEYVEAELEFDSFWNEKFRRAGLSSDRLDAEDIWRLETK